MSPYKSSPPENPARRISGKHMAVGRQVPATKTRIFRSLALCAFLLAACEPAATPGHAETVTFAASKGLGDFEFAVTGSGAPGEWSVVRDDATQALAQTGTDPADDRFPLAIYRPFSARNVYVSIRFMPVPATSIGPAALSCG
jgi:hypothetical protein